jgi:hypothetical protein
MSRKRGKVCCITPAERGVIVQRVLVEGWSIGEAAAAFGHSEVRVAGWVAAYRRRGMASLRDDARGRAPRCWLWLLRIIGIRLAITPRSRDGKPAQSPNGRDHRSRWN